MTRHVRRVHDVPALGRDPSAGWRPPSTSPRGAGPTVLLPVQEQVAVMALARDRIEAAGLATAVPAFAALAQVQDKVSAYPTLARAGVPQPPAVIAAAEAGGRANWPSGGDRAARVREDADRHRVGRGAPGGLAGRSCRRLAADYERLRASSGREGVLVQQPVAGPLAMVQAVFAHGELVAFHACERVREGAAGGASHKLGLAPAARRGSTWPGWARPWAGTARCRRT